MDDPTLLEVGRIVKAHGLRGELVVDLLSDRPERREPGARFVTDHGTLVLRSCRPHQQRWLVVVEGVDDRSSAEALRGATLRAEPLPPLEDDDDVYPDEVVGRRVVDAGGIDRGEVVAIQSNPAADLLVLDSGHLVPLSFVVDIGETIEIDAPDGLFDL